MVRPKRDQIADELRKQIETGEYKVGERLPTENSLIEHWGVSRPTVRDALGLLISEGILRSGRGKGQGYRVQEPSKPIEMPFSNIEFADKRGDSNDRDNWIAVIEDQGKTAEQDISVSIEIPTQIISDRLNIPEGKSVVARRRLRRVDGTPWQIATAYFAEELVRGTLLSEPRDVSAPGGIFKSLGIHQHVFNDEIFIRMPSEHEREELRIDRGVPVAEHVRTSRDRDNEPLACTVTVMPGDRTKITYSQAAS